MAFGGDGRAFIAWSDMREFLPDPPLEPGISGYTLDPYLAVR